MDDMPGAGHDDVPAAAGDPCRQLGLLSFFCLGLLLITCLLLDFIRVVILAFTFNLQVLKCRELHRASW